VRQEKQRLQELKQQVQERHLVPPHQQHLEEHPQQQEEQPQQELSGAAQGVDDTAAAGQQQQLEEAQKQQQQQEQLQQGDEEGLPADVVGLVQEVYGRVAPDLAAQAQAYLWREGVRSFRWVVGACAGKHGDWAAAHAQQACCCLPALCAHAARNQHLPSSSCSTPALWPPCWPPHVACCPTGLPACTRLPACPSLPATPCPCSDLRFVDTADYYENVTSSKMLLNKLFILAREREAAAAGGAAAATAAPAGPSS
jgi:hypothetical protein